MRWPDWLRSVLRPKRDRSCGAGAAGIADRQAAAAPPPEQPSTDPDAFLADVRGVVHVGAALMLERHHYRRRGLDVLWIDANPTGFPHVLETLRHVPGQTAIEALLTDVDGASYDFHIANNHGSSSSIYDFKRHKEIWPQVHFEETVRLESVTLPTLFERERIDPRRFQALVLDTQGSELLVLRGAEPLLNCFQWVKTEAADFEAYAGCCQLRDIADFMERQGYREVSRTRFAGSEGVGHYYDVVYRR